LLDSNDSGPCTLSGLGSNSANLQQVTATDISSVPRVRMNVRKKSCNVRYL